MARESTRRKKENLLARRRFARKFQVLFIVFGILAVIIFISALSITKELKENSASMDLPYHQIVHDYYQGIANLDLEIPRSYTRRGVRTEYDEYVTNLFVSVCMRETYERNGGMLSPPELFVRMETQNRTVWGITGLTIEETSEKKPDQDYPVAGETAAFTISFWLWMPFSPNKETGHHFSIWEYEDQMVLEYVKNRWLVTKVVPIKRDLVESDSGAVLASIKNGNAFTADWAPDSEAITKMHRKLEIAQ